MLSGRSVPAADLARELLHGVHDLGAAAVVERDRQRGPRVGGVSSSALRISFRTERGTRQLRRPMNRIRTFIRWSSSRRRRSRVRLKFIRYRTSPRRAAPVLGREREHGEPRGRPPATAPWTVSQRASSPARVALGPVQAPLLGPATVAVHHDPDVGGDPRRGRGRGGSCSRRRPHEHRDRLHPALQVVLGEAEQEPARFLPRAPLGGAGSAPASARSASGQRAPGRRGPRPRRGRRPGSASRRRRRRRARRRTAGRRCCRRRRRP